MRGDHSRKITLAQREQLLQIFLHMGQEVAAEFCKEYGMYPTYARNYAQTIGKLPQRKTKVPRRDVATRVDHDDPRWAKAIAIGPVVWP